MGKNAATGSTNFNHKPKSERATSARPTQSCPISRRLAGADVALSGNPAPRRISTPYFYEDLGVYEAVSEEQVVRDFYHLIDQGDVTNYFYDDSLLPYKKLFIEYILIDHYHRSHDHALHLELERALLLLTHFQRNLGDRVPIQLIDFVEEDLAFSQIDIMELTDEQFERVLSEEALQAHLQRVAALITTSRREFAVSMYFARHPVAH